MLNEADIEVYKADGYFAGYLKADQTIATSGWLTRERAIKAINRIVELHKELYREGE